MWLIITIVNLWIGYQTLVLKWNWGTRGIYMFVLLTLVSVAMASSYDVFPVQVRETQALILAPTRELAGQIQKVTLFLPFYLPPPLLLIMQWCDLIACLPRCSWLWETTWTFSVTPASEAPMWGRTSESWIMGSTWWPGRLDGCLVSRFSLFIAEDEVRLS